MAADHLRVAGRTQARVQVEDADMARLLEIVRHDLADGAVGPARAGAAEEQAVGMRALAGDDGLAEAGDAGSRDIGRQRLTRARLDRLVPVRRRQQSGQFKIEAVLGNGLAEIDEVAIDVDIVFIDAAGPGEAVRVGRVDQQHRRIGRQVPVVPLAQEAHLAAAAIVPLDPVRARAGDQHAAGVPGADPGGIRGQLLALRAAPRVQPARHRDAGLATGGAELVARGPVVGREMIVVRHLILAASGALPANCDQIARRRYCHTAIGGRLRHSRPTKRASSSRPVVTAGSSGARMP